MCKPKFNFSVHGSVVPVKPTEPVPPKSRLMCTWCGDITDTGHRITNHIPLYLFGAAAALMLFVVVLILLGKV